LIVLGILCRNLWHI